MSHLTPPNPSPGGASQRTAVPNSRLSGFAQQTPQERLASLERQGVIDRADVEIAFQDGGLPLSHADSFIENCIGGFTLPIGVATNFRIDGEDVLIPMAVEESSVVAAASHGAKLARKLGGFRSQPVETIATCQIQIVAHEPNAPIERLIETHRARIRALAEGCHPRLVERGGGVRSIELRILNRPGWYALHIHVDTCEAMGANIVNTIAEEVGRDLMQWLPAEIGLRILTNLTVMRISRVSCEVDPQSLEIAGFSGEEAIRRILMAWEFADADPFRATTHNKGVMNGIDPVVIATGNDWRAVEAGCHAYAARDGRYRPMTRWSRCKASGNLRGEIELPIAVGTIGGVTRLHPGAQAALQMLGHPSSARLSQIIAAVGLAQNLSAIRALACEGIQRGHMALHEKNLEMMKRYDHVAPIAAVHSP